MQKEQISNAPSTPKRKNVNIRRGTVLFTNQNTGQKFGFRLDSPRTNEAFQELGIDIKNYEFNKTPDDFGRPGSQSYLKEIRYKKWLQRFEKDSELVKAKRLEIIQRKKMTGVQNINESQDINQLQQIENNNTQSNLKRYQSTQNFLVGQQANLSRSIMESRKSQREINNLYSKTIEYLRQSHNTPRTLEAEQLLQLDQKEPILLEDMMSAEISKYNRLKEKKQREAKMLFEDDVKKLRMIEEMKKKEIQQLKLASKQNKLKEEQKKFHEQEQQEREQKKKDSEQQYKQKKYEERQKIKSKLEHFNQKLQKEFEEKEKIKKEKITKIEQKRDQILKFKSQEEMKQINQMQIELNEINDRFEYVEDKVRQSKMFKSETVKNKIEQDLQKVQKFKSVIENQDAIKVNKLIDSLQKQEKQLEKNVKSKIKQEAERRQRQQDEKEEFMERKKRVKDDFHSKTGKVNEKLTKIEQYLEKKKQDEEKHYKIKQELTRLKEQEMHELAERNQRKEEYKKSQILQKERENDFRIKNLKYQQDILKKTRQYYSIQLNNQLIQREIQQQAKIEKERIFETYQVASEKLFPSVGFDSKLNIISPLEKKKGLNFLKQIFKEEDLKNTNIFEAQVKDDKDKIKKI